MVYYTGTLGTYLEEKSKRLGYAVSLHTSLSSSDISK